MSDHFFPDRVDRPCLAWALAELPFPPALTYTRVHEAMDRGQPVEAVWAVRDALECFIKFNATLAAADLLAHDADPARAEAALGLLFAPQGQSLGAWTELLVGALRPLAPAARDGTLDAAGRACPGLFRAFYQEGKSKLAARPAWAAVHDKFAAWRNEVFGHGVFKHDPAWYAAEALAWLAKLHALYDDWRPALAGWRLVARTAGGEIVDWQGCDFAPGLPRHEHVPGDRPDAMLLVREGGRELPLGPLLTVQRCGDCGEPAAFFFDRQKLKDGRPSRSSVLEYFRGHLWHEPPWGDVARLHARLPPNFRWERRVYDTGELEGERIAFREFERDYLPPEYLVRAVWGAVERLEKGYLIVTGPEGVGKSYLVEGLATREQAPSGRVVVVRVHLRPGTASECQFLVTEIREALREKLPGLRTVDVQLRVAEGESREAGRARLREEFADYLRAVIQKDRPDALVVALDGLDNLPAPPPGEPGLLDLLPDAADLEPGCFLLLTTRTEAPPHVTEALQRLRAAPAEFREEWHLDPAAADNRALVRDYLARELPEPLRTPEVIDHLLELSRGVFLYAAHYCRALQRGAFTDPSALPAPEHFYPAFLAALEARVGPQSYAEVYRPLLLTLAAAFVPVTLEQLQSWLPHPERVKAALADLGDFVSARRVRTWHEGMSDSDEPRYALAHDDFARFVTQDQVLSAALRQQHEILARHALQAGGKMWENMDPADDGDLYALRFAIRHAEGACRTDWVHSLGRSEAYALALWGAVVQLGKTARVQLAIECSSAAELIYRRLVQSGRRELESDLASALVNKAVALDSLGQSAVAVVACDEAIAILRPLVQAGRQELEENLARALVSRGNALQGVGQLEEALEAYDEAIAINRSLVQAKRKDLENNLASNLINRGIALQGLGQLGEALAAFNEAIAILDRLAQGGRRDLAIALVNQGIALAQQGQWEEAAAAYDKTIVLLRRLVQGGRPELENDLAGALMNKGVALYSLGHLAEAVAALDEAIAIRRRLVQGGRPELGNGLAYALMNRGNLLKQCPDPGTAMGSFDEAIGLWLSSVREGREYAVAHLLEALGTRLDLARRLARWPAVVESLALGLDIILPRLQPDPTPLLQEGLSDLAWYIAQLTPDDRRQVLTAAGEGADAIVSLFEQVPPVES